MKILFTFIIFILSFSSAYANTFYIGKWEVINVSKKCAIGSYFKDHILTINENRSALFESDSWFTFRGKVSSSWKKIGLNNQYGTLNVKGNFNGTLINAKFNNLAEWNVRHCDFQLQKIIETKKQINEDRWLFCQNLFDETITSKKYQRCDSSEQEISEDEFNKLNKPNLNINTQKQNPISKPKF